MPQSHQSPLHSTDESHTEPSQCSGGGDADGAEDADGGGGGNDLKIQMTAPMAMQRVGPTRGLQIQGRVLLASANCLPSVPLPINDSWMWNRTLPDAKGRSMHYLLQNAGAQRFAGIL